MKKLEYEEIGILITREIRAMLLDDNISFEDRGKIMRSIITGEAIENPMMRAFADSLRSGYELTNNKRKAEILARRERQKTYARDKRSSTVDAHSSKPISVDISTVDARTSTNIYDDERASLNRTEQNRTKQNSNIPPKSPKGDCGEPVQISPEDLIAQPDTESRRKTAAALAEKIEKSEAFQHSHVNRGRLIACLVSCLKKNTAREIEDGFEKHLEKWRADGWRFVPNLDGWLLAGKYLDVVVPDAGAAAMEKFHDDVFHGDETV